MQVYEDAGLKLEEVVDRMEDSDGSSREEVIMEKRQALETSTRRSMVAVDLSKAVLNAAQEAAKAKEPADESGSSSCSDKGHPSRCMLHASC